MARHVPIVSWALVTEDSDASMTLDVILHHLETSSAVMTLGAIPVASRDLRLAGLSFGSDETETPPRSQPLLRNMQRYIIDYNQSEGSFKLA
jgi:hypothetical protein